MERIGIPFHFKEEHFEIVAPEFLIPTIEATIRSVLPRAQFGTGMKLTAHYKWEDDSSLPLQVGINLSETTPWVYSDSEILDPVYIEVDRKRRIKERIRLGVQRVLEERFALSTGSWGILKGVRPTKLVHSLHDRGFFNDQIEFLLQDVYALNSEKIDLLMDVVERQRNFFNPSVNNPISVYVGIPFCPTRCSYCSFAAYPLKTHGHLFNDFLQALKSEIEQLGALIKDIGLDVETIYLGGGTPTTVQGKDLSELLDLIQENFITDNTTEFTVEAGRPETLLADTIGILKKAGVDRISINPQSMHDATLKAIGREHTVKQVYEAFSLARDAGIPIINMDIILGLPGEELIHVEKTLERVFNLKPDNLTVHSLALKRASRLKKTFEQEFIAHKQGEVMARLAREVALSAGMVPYYLYRQRHILGDLENVGYAFPQTESVYNIQMMEERQTVLGLGGGSITKLVSPDLSLKRLVNPKCPASYSQLVKGGIKPKIDQIRKHLVV